MVWYDLTDGMRRILHETIFQELRREIIHSRKPGDWMEPESQMAKRFEVSMVTLRNATLALEREGWVRRVPGVGVQICNRRKQQHVALVLPELTVTPVPLVYHMRFASLLQSKLARLGWDTCLYLSINDESEMQGLGELKRALENHRVAAVIMTLDDCAPEHIRNAAKVSSAPIWSMTKYGQFTPAVDCNKMIPVGVEQLVARGARRIAAILPGPPLGSDPSSKSHSGQVFRAELKKRGLQVEEGWVADNSEARLPGSGWEGFRDLWSARVGRPDGLLVLDDVQFHDAARAIYELGIRVPEDIQIVTHSNKDDGYMHPFPVTRLEVDADKIAENCAAFVHELLEGRQPSPKHVDFKVLPAETRFLPVSKSKADFPQSL
jgi:DNA-binding LacI/PurR family transcriptional regulator